MKYKNENEWYGSNEHFRTELSWEEYLENQELKKRFKKRKGLGLF